MSSQLEIDLLSRTKAPDDALSDLRSDLEDALKEYGDLDLLVELTQNALDALEDQRYRSLCAVAKLDPDKKETILKWNASVDEVLESDYLAYVACTSTVDKATYYANADNDLKRRAEYWKVLGSKFGCDSNALSNAVTTLSPHIKIRVNADSPVWIEIEDNAAGMLDVVSCFRHKQSQKRQSKEKIRRYGTRGSHGWGLTALLAMSDEVQVISRTSHGAKAYQFRNYASFTNEEVGAPTNIEIDLESTEASKLSERLRKDGTSTGTHLRVQVAIKDTDQLLSNTLHNFSAAKFANLLRLYTPIGQVNDFLLHPAYHTYRRGDLEVILITVKGGAEKIEKVPFDIFRISECPNIARLSFYAYVNSGMSQNHSVHTIHRAKKGDSVYLSAAEIQPVDPVLHQVEAYYFNDLPAYSDENGKEQRIIPRGFNLALSGGMRAELLVRPPRSTSAAFRGFVLSEALKPTLGRKHVMDQRQSPAKVAAEHESAYDDVRRKVLPIAVPPVASPAAAKWRREFFDAVLKDLASQPPISADLRTWAGVESLEARVMLTFGELLQRGQLGAFHILRCHLQDRYDFAFFYSIEVGEVGAPLQTVLENLRIGGWLTAVGNKFHRYGFGEFKAAGDQVFDDFDPKEPRKSPDTIDLLVCWTFDPVRVVDEGWTSEPVSEAQREFSGQTHIWRAGPTSKFLRSRVLAVLAIEDCLKSAIGASQYKPSPTPWALPINYF